MKSLKTVAVTLSMALLVSAPAFAYGKGAKQTPEQKAAIKKCNDDYQSALKDAKAKKGKDRTDAVAAAKKSHKECLASAKK